MNYYSYVFTESTWKAFLRSGRGVVGFSAGQRRSALRLQPGDRLLCYVRRRFEWVASLEVVGQIFESDTELWDTDNFPIRTTVKVLASVDSSHGAHINQLAGQLSFLPVLDAPNWGSHLQGSPRVLAPGDARVIESAVTVAAQAADSTAATLPEPPEFNHSRCQAELAKLGHAMQCDVWVPKSDRTKLIPYAPDANLLPELPVVLGGAVQNTMANIDVLWLRGQGVVSAFEVEHSTSIYSGILRMADLVTVLPNLEIPFYICAPSKRTPDVAREIQRPVFASMRPALATRCLFISYEALAEFVSKSDMSALAYTDPRVMKTIARDFSSVNL